MTADNFKTPISADRISKIESLLSSKNKSSQGLMSAQKTGPYDLYIDGSELSNLICGGAKHRFERRQGTSC